MEKLMDTDPYDRAMPRKMIGHDMFGDTYPTCSTTCQKQTDCDDCPIQEAFARLRQYERTGLNPEEIAELKERDTAKAAIITGYNRAIGCKVGECPKCGAMTRDYLAFCSECGQRLKWEERL